MQQLTMDYKHFAQGKKRKRPPAASGQGKKRYEIAVIALNCIDSNNKLLSVQVIELDDGFILIWKRLKWRNSKSVRYNKGAKIIRRSYKIDLVTKTCQISFVAHVQTHYRLQCTNYATNTTNEKDQRSNKETERNNTKCIVFQPIRVTKDGTKDFANCLFSNIKQITRDEEITHN